MSVAKCSTDRLRRSCSLTLLRLRSPGFQVPHIQRLLRSFRWIGVPYLQFQFVLRFRHLRVWVVMGQVVWVLLHSVLGRLKFLLEVSPRELAPAHDDEHKHQDGEGHGADDQSSLRLTLHTAQIPGRMCFLRPSHVPQVEEISLALFNAEAGIVVVARLVAGDAAGRAAVGVRGAVLLELTDQLPASDAI